MMFKFYLLLFFTVALSCAYKLKRIPESQVSKNSFNTNNKGLSSSASSENKKIKVFILAGQSNMVGYGQIKPHKSDLGTLKYLVGEQECNNNINECKKERNNNDNSCKQECNNIKYNCKKQCNRNDEECKLECTKNKKECSQECSKNDDIDDIDDNDDDNNNTNSWSWLWDKCQCNWKKFDNITVITFEDSDPNDNNNNNQDTDTINIYDVDVDVEGIKTQLIGRESKLQANVTGQNKRFFGPELGFGYKISKELDSEILLIKTAWGGQSLYQHFRAPGKDHLIDKDLLMGDKRWSRRYHEMVKAVKEVLANGPNKEQYELAGIIWHQGWNDRVQSEFVDQYLENLVNLINQLREDFREDFNNNDSLPFILANTGQGWLKDKDKELKDTPLKLMRDQLIVPYDSRLYNKINVDAVDTRDLNKLSFDNGNAYPSKQASHWNQNAEIYLKIGIRLAEKTAEIINNSQYKPSYVRYEAENQSYNEGDIIEGEKPYGYTGKGFVRLNSQSSNPSSITWNSIKASPGSHEIKISVIMDESESLDKVKIYVNNDQITPTSVYEPNDIPVESESNSLQGQDSSNEEHWNDWKTVLKFDAELIEGSNSIRLEVSGNQTVDVDNLVVKKK